MTDNFTIEFRPEDKDLPIRALAATGRDITAKFINFCMGEGLPLDSLDKVWNAGFAFAARFGLQR